MLDSYCIVSIVSVVPGWGCTAPGHFSWFLVLNGLMSELNSCKIQSRLSKSSLSLRHACVSGAEQKEQ